jgi:hypothetical protein
MRRAAVFEWWKRFRDGETNMKGQNRVSLSSWSLRQTVCSTFSRNGWSVIRSASLAKWGTSKKRPSPHLHEVPTWSNKVSPRTFQTALVFWKKGENSIWKIILHLWITKRPLKKSSDTFYFIYYKKICHMIYYRLINMNKNNSIIIKLKDSIEDCQNVNGARQDSHCHQHYLTYTWMKWLFIGTEINGAILNTLLSTENQVLSSDSQDASQRVLYTRGIQIKIWLFYKNY